MVDGHRSIVSDVEGEPDASAECCLALWPKWARTRRCGLKRRCPSRRSRSVSLPIRATCHRISSLPPKRSHYADLAIANFADAGVVAEYPAELRDAAHPVELLLLTDQFPGTPVTALSDRRVVRV